MFTSSINLVASVFHWTPTVKKVDLNAVFDTACPARTYLNLEETGQYKIVGTCSVYCEALTAALIREMEGAFYDTVQTLKGDDLTVTDIHRSDCFVQSRGPRSGDMYMFIDRYQQMSSERFILTPHSPSPVKLERSRLNLCQGRPAPLALCG